MVLRHYTKVLREATINPAVIKSEYAVRGYIPTIAGKIKEDLLHNPKSYNFDHVVELNIGNPLIFSTNPIWVLRELSTVALNTGMDSKVVTDAIKSSPVLGPLIKDNFLKATEVKKLFTRIRDHMYVQGKENVSGYWGVKQEVANMISKRDGFKSAASRIFLSNGASTAIRSILEVLIDGPKVGIMTPIPQYPLYSGLITLFNGKIVPYMLNEKDNWNLSMETVERSYTEAKAQGIEPRAIVLINPGNPTGNVFDIQKMREIITFAHKHKLVILADEVYQENVYCKKQWESFRKVLNSMEGPERKEVELVSFHSLSKGILSECGLRGGYMEFTNIDETFTKAFQERISNNWPNAIGQAMLMLKSMYLSGKLENLMPDVLFNYMDSQYKELKNSLRFRAELAHKRLNNGTTLKCNEIEGAMYAFPRVFLPEKLIKRAADLKLKPDVLYCKSMLESSGICLVPGSGFGQEEGTFHFRTTILPTPDTYFEQVFDRLSATHQAIMDHYS